MYGDSLQDVLPHQEKWEGGQRYKRKGKESAKLSATITVLNNGSPQPFTVYT